jgi:hypothetical protein
VNVSKVTLERVDEGWLFPVSATALQHALSPLPSQFEQFSFFTTACLYGEKFFKFWHIPKIYVQQHPMSVSFSGNQILYLSVYSSSFPFFFYSMV